MKKTIHLILSPFSNVPKLPNAQFLEQGCPIAKHSLKYYSVRKSEPI